MTTSNTNSKYISSDTSSVYNLKQNLNSFINDFAELDFNNIVENSDFDSINYVGIPFLNNWSASGVSNINYNTTSKYLTSTIASGGFLKQEISANLKRDTNYSLIFYGSASVSGAIQVQVNTTNDYQIISLGETIETNSASIILNESASGLLEKHIINFKTTATSAVEPNIYVTIKNLNNTPVSGTFKKIMVYSSLIELGDLPSFKELPLSPNIVAGQEYYQMIFDGQGRAVSGSTTNHLLDTLLPIQSHVVSGSTYYSTVYNQFGIAVSGSTVPNTLSLQSNIVSGGKYFITEYNENGIAVSGSQLIDGKFYGKSFEALEDIGGTLPQFRMKNSSSGRIGFCDNKDPDLGIYNYQLMMDNGYFYLSFGTSATSGTEYQCNNDQFKFKYDGSIFISNTLFYNGLTQTLIPLSDHINNTNPHPNIQTLGSKLYIYNLYGGL